MASLSPCLSRVKSVHLSHDWQDKYLHSLFLSPAHFNTQVLIHPIEALCILNGNVKFLPQFLKRFIWRQVQSIEALEGESKDKEHTKGKHWSHSSTNRDHLQYVWSFKFFQINADVVL